MAKWFSIGAFDLRSKGRGYGPKACCRCVLGKGTSPTLAMYECGMSEKITGGGHRGETGSHTSVSLPKSSCGLPPASDVEIEKQL